MLGKSQQNMIDLVVTKPKKHTSDILENLCRQTYLWSTHSLRIVGWIRLQMKWKGSPGLWVDPRWRQLDELTFAGRVRWSKATMSMTRRKTWHQPTLKSVRGIKMCLISCACLSYGLGLLITILLIKKDILTLVLRFDHIWITCSQFWNITHAPQKKTDSFSFKTFFYFHLPSIKSNDCETNLIIPLRKRAQEIDGHVYTRLLVTTLNRTRGKYTTTKS